MSTLSKALANVSALEDGAGIGMAQESKHAGKLASIERANELRAARRGAGGKASGGRKMSFKRPSDKGPGPSTKETDAGITAFGDRPVPVRTIAVGMAVDYDLSDQVSGELQKEALRLVVIERALDLKTLIDTYTEDGTTVAEAAVTKKGKLAGAKLFTPTGAYFASARISGLTQGDRVVMWLNPKLTSSAASLTAATTWDDTHLTHAVDKLEGEVVADLICGEDGFIHIPLGAQSGSWALEVGRDDATVVYDIYPSASVAMGRKFDRFGFPIPKPRAGKSRKGKHSFKARKVGKAKSK